MQIQNKRHWWKVAVILPVAWFMGVALQIQVYTYSSATVSGDVAIVLGAAVWNASPSPVFEERINHAINLYRTDQVECIVFTGGVGDGDQFAESKVAREYAIERGIPDERIYTETTSHVTYENLAEAKRIIDRHRLGRALVVSDPLHMKRAVTIARDLGLDAYPSPTRTSRYRTWRTKLPFLIRESWYYTTYLLRRSFLVGERPTNSSPEAQIRPTSRCT